MQKLDGGIEEVNGWIDGAEKKMNEMERQGPNDAVLKVLIFIFILVVFALPKWSHFYELFFVIVHFIQFGYLHIQCNNCMIVLGFFF